MAVADGGVRSATVPATRDGDVVVAVPGPEFIAVMGRYPSAARLVAAELSRKPRHQGNSVWIPFNGQS
jgi:CRP-like cAMP-binding protein